MPLQDLWRFCGKCHTMFFDGSPDKGPCAAGGDHTAIGFNFALPFDVPPTNTAQKDWRFCGKCHTMFFDGSPDKGRCAAGGGHAAIGFNFVLPHDVPATATAQSDWRFCGKCHTMFFDGFPDKGRCVAGDGHAAIGFNFVLPHDLRQVVTLDSGSITSGLTIGGFARLVMSQAGDFTFSGHMHNSGGLGIDYVLTLIALTPSGIAYTVQRSGHTAGTFTSGSRDDDWTIPGFNDRIRDNWEQASQAHLSWTLHANDTLTPQVGKALEEALQEAIKAVGAAAVKAVIALL